MSQCSLSIFLILIGDFCCLSFFLCVCLFIENNFNKFKVTRAENKNHIIIIIKNFFFHSVDSFAYMTAIVCYGDVEKESEDVTNFSIDKKTPTRWRWMENINLTNNNTRKYTRMLASKVTSWWILCVRKVPARNLNVFDGLKLLNLCNTQASHAEHPSIFLSITLKFFKYCQVCNIFFPKTK